MTQNTTPAQTIVLATQRLLGRRPAFSHALSPEPVSLLSAPNGYAETYGDVPRARALSVIADPDLHYTLYGRQQGRDVLPRIVAGVSRVVVISPSHLKQCGIGEYGRYLSDEMAKQVEELHVVRTSSAALALGPEFLKGALVLVNHGPGLYDGLNPRLSQGESTTRLLQNLDRMKREMGALPLIIHHSLLDTEHELLFSRQQQIMNSDIPSIAFISSAGRHFFLPTLELGVSPVPVPEHDYADNRDERPEAVGFFGFFQYGGKDFDSLFHLVREIRGRLVGSVATSNADELKRFEETLENLHLPHDLGSGWVTDMELLERLKEADYFYLPQNDYDHWNNSATARFVTNLDRPLFLPPHHPFLDMEDGSIFAATEDLPRIVAHFREPGHYAQAVERVRAFRERAQMANTATAIRTALVDRQSEVGQTLLETPSVCSLERFMELSEAEQSLFMHQLGADPEFPESYPALWRAPEARQYWRKHYELGDLVHSTLLESLHAIYMACAKRDIGLEELMGLLAEGAQNGTEGRPHWPLGKTLSAAFAQALEDKGGPFHDPEIVLLDRGHAVAAESVMTPARIEQFQSEKSARRAQITTQLRARLQKVQPPITNLAQLLLLPAETLRQRDAPLDLSALDLDHIHAPRRPAQRMNRLVAAANAAGLRLGDHLVFDQLIPPAVDPRVASYVLEDFIYFDGDYFLLNAIRCIDKRDPFAFEVVVLSRVLGTLGKLDVLRHLLHRAEGRVEITNLAARVASGRDIETDAQEVQRFLDAARDPLFGLVSPRNAYEIAKRHNTRWWLRTKTGSDALWTGSQGNVGLLTLIYAYLCETPSDRANPAGRRDDPIWQIDRKGCLHPEPETRGVPLGLSLNTPMRINPEMAETFTAATIGFHAPEAAGAWTNGPEGTLLLRSEKAIPAGTVLSAELGFYGGEAMEGPRHLSVMLRRAGQPVMPLLDGDVPAAFGLLDVIIDRDQLTAFDMVLPDIPAETDCLLHLSLDRVSSPAQLGLSDDPRQLGVLLRGLGLVAPDSETSPQNPSHSKVEKEPEKAE
ncbi:hypothetical protein J4E08_22460 [Sagittula sp. NFXS13]|uniref:hypothetical protein n=1 Tax=Sagittula sp. NFXS13 TaxID=2819095 RepID=UPI0032DF760F